MKLSARTRERAVNVALGLLSFVLVAGGAEGLARRWGRPAPDRTVGPFITDWADWDGDFYTVKSSAVGWPPWEDYNSEGLRDRDHATLKPKGMTRVVCLGDSVTLGWGLRPEESYPRLLQDRLDAFGASAEVLNVALGGWATRQERIAYARIARRYSPDVVLVGLCLNDVPEMINNLERPPGWLAFLHRHSALIRSVVDAQGREIRAIDDLFSRPDAPAVRRGWSRVFDDLRELRDLVSADGARLALLTFPYRPQLRTGFAAPRPQQEVARFCESEHLPCLDLLPALRDAGDDAFIDHVHLSATGSRRVAEEILDSGVLGDVASEPGEGTSGVASEAAVFVPSRPRAQGADAPSNSLPSRAGEPQASRERLIAALHAAEADARARAVWSLSESSSDAAAAADELARLVEDPDPRVRAGAARALGRCPPQPDAVVSSLIRHLEDSDERVAWRASEALSGMDLGEAQVGALIAIAGRSDSTGRATAIETLGRMGPVAETAVPLLVAALADPRRAVRDKAVWALGTIGRQPRVAVPALVAMLNDPAVAWRAADALAAFRADAAPAVRPLIAALGSDNASLRWRAAQTLGRLGDVAIEAAPALVTAASDDQTNVRLAALHSLAQLRASPLVVESVFDRALSDADPRVRRQAALGLGRLGPAARPALRHLHETLADSDAEVRTAAGKALERIEHPREGEGQRAAPLPRPSPGD
jgi:HEAT repeat protein/lysophospholipase L1-like esterase